MLEIRGLKKIYTASGTPVRAVDGISLRFGERGMVFLLGKSGSGKSTLLNLCGGLDMPDEGEIVIDGRSSADFAPSDFDSYRNTYVGFVFQEYNILEEFTVAENIGIALELQGQGKNRARIEEILREVDLEGMADRKPNTLSGGQRQRVAIARALVKDPRIIMADEPTGALDSVTGRQILSTLKKLSADKLVLVVSHDREFAETYADRIIELMDGKVVSDMSRAQTPAQKAQDAPFVLTEEGGILIKKGARLTADDLERFNALLSEDKDTLLTVTDRPAWLQNSHDAGGNFVPTAPDESAETVQREPRFIRSRLPLRHALRIGASSLRAKPFRLAFTVLLSVIALTMFGLFSTLSFFDRAATSLRTYRDLGYEQLMLENSYTQTTLYYHGNDVTGSRETGVKVNFSAAQYEEMRSRYGSGVLGLYNFDNSPTNAFYQIYNAGVAYDTVQYYYPYLTSFAAVQAGSVWEDKLLTDTDLASLGKDDVVISSYFFDALRHCSLFDETGDSHKIELESYDDILGKPLVIGGSSVNRTVTLTVRGVYRCDLPDTFDGLLDSPPFTEETEALVALLGVELSCGLYQTALVSEEFYGAHLEAFDRSGIPRKQGVFLTLGNGFTLYGKQGEEAAAYQGYVDDVNSYPPVHDDMPTCIARLDGKDAAAPLADGEIILSFGALSRQLTAMAEEQAGRMSAADAAAWVQKLHEYEKLLDGGTAYDPDATEADYAEAAEAALELIGMFEEDDPYAFDPHYKLVCEYADGSSFVYFADVVGFFYGDLNDTSYDNACYVSENDYAMIGEMTTRTKGTTNTLSYTPYRAPDDCIYRSIVVPVDGTRQMRGVLSAEGSKGADSTYYSVVSPVAYLIGSVTGVMDTLEIIFLSVGAAMALFSVLLLYNFMSASVSYKKKEIGILRAVGARSADVMRIFFSEAALIGLACFVLSLLACVIVCNILNGVLLGSIRVAFFIFGPLSWTVMLAIALLTSFLGTFLPVRAIARRRPVDSIRSL